MCVCKNLRRSKLVFFNNPHRAPESKKTKNLNFSTFPSFSFVRLHASCLIANCKASRYERILKLDGLLFEFSNSESWGGGKKTKKKTKKQNKFVGKGVNIVFSLQRIDAIIISKQTYITNLREAVGQIREDSVEIENSQMQLRNCHCNAVAAA